MKIQTSLSTIPKTQFSYQHAAHLLDRAGFGGTPQQIQALQKLGLDKAITLLVDFKPQPQAYFQPQEIDKDLIKPQTREEKKARRLARKLNDEVLLSKLQKARNIRRNKDRKQIATLANRWLERMISTSNPLEEKMMLLWHSHFASNYRTVRDSFLLYQQHQTLRKNALGNFKDLAYDIIKDPAMIRFLDNNSNVKGKPNENLAREIMELFTLGQGNYTEKDIKEGARALTGRTFNDNDYVFNNKQHDYGRKKILGKSGYHQGKDFVRILLKQSACYKFVAFKLYKHFIADIQAQPNPSQQKVIDRIAYLLRKEKFQFKPVLKTIFKSKHFYDPSIIAHKIKSPAQLIVGTIRKLNAPPRDIAVLSDAMAIMGQKLFDPPSVKGWDGGRSWINTATLFTRHNITTYIASGKLPNNKNWNTDDIQYQPEKLVDSTEPKEIAKQLAARLLSAKPSPQVLKTIQDLFDARQGQVNSNTILASILIIMAMPEFQIV